MLFRKARRAQSVLGPEHLSYCLVHAAGSLAQLVKPVLQGVDLFCPFLEGNTLQCSGQSWRGSPLVLDIVAEFSHLKGYPQSILQGVSDPDKFPLDHKHFEYEDIKP